MTIMLIGNKCDLERRRQVSVEEGKTFAEENGLMFLEISATKLLTMLKKFRRRHCCFLFLSLFMYVRYTALTLTYCKLVANSNDINVNNNNNNNNKKAFVKPAQQIYQKIQRGIYDVSNEQYGIKVGMASQTNQTTTSGSKSKTTNESCCVLL
ncbi:ras-related protein rab-2a [Reticulomyxa filosa]|uniref:Ras-related protein rab-2a n=1 Tax=Reticulomyxa filosa TaxID=46433 RepID=X6LLP1_RETFI|nr:ras-related protein rab-2a [Reticulomyxa filosa]|eukprot:ETO02534.1 ras-related protein rab-2a [Reticulomyxa filosa]